MIKAREFLLKKGFDISYSGFEYLAYILSNYTVKKLYETTQGEIYHKISLEYNKKPSTVERTLRYIKDKSEYKDKKLKNAIIEIAIEYNK